MIVELALRISPEVAARRIRARGAVSCLVANAEGLRDDGRYSFVVGAPRDWSDALVPPVREKWCGHAAGRAAPRWIGHVRYDGRAEWAFHDAVARFDRWSGRVVLEADDLAALNALRDALRDPSSGESDPSPGRIENARFLDDAATHRSRIERALEAIRAGDIYEINLARRIQFEHQGDELTTFFDMTRRAPTPFGGYLELGDGSAILATSPELALAWQGGIARTAPMKGTRPRGSEAIDDAKLRADLEHSPKEEAELVMATDLHRNDLARVAEPGTVRVIGPARIAVGRTVFTRLREVSARAPLGPELLASLLPCGSVTGAPKHKAMEIIESFESEPRGIYTGAYGFVGRDGSLVLAMTIRTAHLAASTRGSLRPGEYWTGGGIVIGSDPDAEVAETEWKAVQLMGLASSRDATAVSAEREGAPNLAQKARLR